MDIRQQHRLALQEFVDRAAQVKADQWDAPTPCEGWTVRDLVDHVVGGNQVVPRILAGRPLNGTVDGLGGDPISQVHEAAKAAAAAVMAEVDLTSIKHPPHGDFTAEVYIYQRLAENLIHGWDLARATGDDERLDPALVETCGAFFDQAEDLYRQAGFVGPRVPVSPGSDPQAVLLARFGRS